MVKTINTMFVFLYINKKRKERKLALGEDLRGSSSHGTGSCEAVLTKESKPGLLLKAIVEEQLLEIQKYKGTPGAISIFLTFLKMSSQSHYSK